MVDFIKPPAFLTDRIISNQAVEPFFKRFDPLTTIVMSTFLNIIQVVLYLKNDWHLKRIHDVCSGAGVQVEFLTEEYGFTVRFHRHCGKGWKTDGVQKNIQSAKGSLNGTLNGTLGSDKAKLKDLISHNPKITRKQMADSLGISLRSVQRLLNEIEDVRFTGGGRSGHWEIV